MSETDAFEFAESEVASIAPRGLDLVIRFSAARVWRALDDAPNVRLDGFMHGMELVCGLHLLAVDDACFGAVRQGRLTLNGETRAQWPVPLRSADAYQLALWFVNGSSCTLAGRGVSLHPTPGAQWREWLRC